MRSMKIHNTTWQQRKDDKLERARIKARRELLGDKEITRRTVLYDQAQQICAGVLATPFQNAGNANDILKMAEGLREKIRTWIWENNE